MSAYGVLGLTASISMENSVIANCGANTFIGYYGGDYLINNCTFYNSANGRRDPHVIFNNILRNDNKQIIRTYDISFSIRNSILWGPLDTEFGVDLTNDSKVLLASMTYSLYKSKTDLGGTGNIRSKDPLFEDISRLNFKLKAASPAIGKANPATATLTDFDEKSRDANPDMGAYEF